DRPRRHFPAQLRGLQAGLFGGLADRCLARDLERRLPEHGRDARYRAGLSRPERLAEIDLRGRLVLLAPADRGQQTDDPAPDEADPREPPAQDDRAPDAAEIDLLPGVEIAVALALVRGSGAHRGATLAEAHSH